MMDEMESMMQRNAEQMAFMLMQEAPQTDLVLVLIRRKDRTGRIVCCAGTKEEAMRWGKNLRSWLGGVLSWKSPE